MSRSFNKFLASVFPRFMGADQHLQTVIRGGSIVLILRIIGTALAYAFNIVLARVLGVDGAGIYFLALTIITVGALIGRIGLDNSMLRFTAVHAVKEEWGKVLGVFQNGVRITLIGSSIITVFIILVSPWMAVELFNDPELTNPLRVMALAISPMALSILYGEVFKGLERVGEATIVQSISLPAVSILILALFYKLATPTITAFFYVIASLLTLAISHIIWRHITPHLRTINGWFDREYLIKTTIPLFWVALIYLAINWTDTLLIGIYMDSSAVGVYNVTIRTVKLIAFGLIAVNSIVAPTFASLYSRRDFKTLDKVSRNIAALMAAFTAPLWLIFLLFPEWVLSVFGGDFIAGATAMRILATGQFVNVCTGAVGYLLIMCGFEKVMRNSVLIFALLNVILNILLIPIMGIVGASIATAVSLSGMNLMFVWLVYRKLNVVSLPIGRFGR